MEPCCKDIAIEVRIKKLDADGNVVSEAGHREVVSCKLVDPDADHQTIAHRAVHEAARLLAGGGDTTSHQREVRDLLKPPANQTSAVICSVLEVTDVLLMSGETIAARSPAATLTLSAGPWGMRNDWHIVGEAEWRDIAMRSDEGWSFQCRLRGVVVSAKTFLCSRDHTTLTIRCHGAPLEIKIT